MDLSVLAAVGSFMMSERILKPKGTVVFVMGCVFIYDLSTHTHDPTSLRCYRGPGLMAFSLLCCAFCLRTWRRNGVACDELLFLPGTLYGAKHGLERHSEHEDIISDENDNSSSNNNDLEMIEQKSSTDNSKDEGDASEGDAAAGAPQGILRPRLGSAAQPADINTDDNEATSLYGKSITLLCGLYRRTSRLAARTHRSPRNSSSNSNNLRTTTHSAATSPTNNESNNTNSNTTLASLFSSSNDAPDHTYAPSGPSVLNASFDLCLPVLINFHLFVSASHQTKSSSSSTRSSSNNNSSNNDDDSHQNDDIPSFDPKLLPLIFLTIIFVRTQIPPSRRKRFYTVLKRTACAPFKTVIFRDAFLADLITSFIRPLLDFIFAISYYLTAVYGAFTSKYTLTQAAAKLETSWLLHNCLLPASAMLPLWWKFLQTLRQAHDKQQRWPYLGDSFKYLTANLVILYGMSHQEKSRSSWWIVSFLFTTIYQIVWDTIIDWDLFIFPSSSGITANLSMLISSPKQFYNSIQLRHTRLYKTTSIYYRIFFLNFILRFTWMLCFIPAYHLSIRSGTIRPTFSRDDMRSYVSPTLSALEIVRRTLWCILKLELETIKITDCSYDTLPTSSSHLFKKEGREEGEGENDGLLEDDDDGSLQQQQQHQSDNQIYSISTTAAKKNLEVASSSSSENNKTSIEEGKDDNDNMELFLPLRNERYSKSNSHSSSSVMISSISSFFSSPSVQRKLFILELSIWAAAYVGLGYWSLTIEGQGE